MIIKLFDKKYNKNNISIQTILSLIKNYNTPFWLYCAENIKDKITQLKQFDTIRFAQKACSNINILKLMRYEGVKVDAISLGEIERAIVAGYNPKKINDIIFTSDVFDKETLRYIKKSNITVNVGSIDMLYQLGYISKGHNILLRINPGFGYGHNKKTNTGGEKSKHGIWYEDLKNAISIIKKFNLNLIGIHMHIGSGVNYQHLEKVCNSMLYNVLQTYMPKIDIISAGGGLSIPYKINDLKVDTNHYFNLWNNTRNIIKNFFKKNIKLEIEPGRFLVAESGILICQVCAIKIIKNRRFVLVNIGFNDLIRPVMYGSYHYISAISSKGKDMSIYPKVKTIVAGPLCESGDIFTQTDNGEIIFFMLPIVNIGDYLIFHDTGAYGASMSSNYNSRPLIPEILIENNIPKIIRRRQKIKDLINLELF
ncbi:diaminopimelate decarboxylase [Enterobacteriaceae endosymbiont of Donacia versicolorea]|uniref:diaminopimelate decarboxylase n=1 Tax=Enterobacteriaceae endosymbiont of Donacia versicolorea TaxID=2675788 RepID=UPI001449B4D5|nr:diaminopimelate decarboxylase [Enterobacteriaceae endosymbiont of Donacia versicolorea]QJC32253.1 diaminopimelate decarboxylase [Enterobacteriaceae endosymbiont of Donacia versicolorea]